MALRDSLPLEGNRTALAFYFSVPSIRGMKDSVWRKGKISAMNYE